MQYTKRFWFYYGDSITEFAKAATPVLGGGAVVAALLYLAIMIYISSTTLKIEGLLFHPKSEFVTLACYQGGERVIIDSMYLTPNGRFTFRVTDAQKAPMLYEVESDGQTIPMLGSIGETIKIEALNPISTNYWISGSTESKLLQEHFQQFLIKVERLEHIATNYAATTPQKKGAPLSSTASSTDQKSQSELELEYNTTYSEIKQLQRRFITQNKEQMAAIYALFMRIPGEDFLFSEELDTTYMNMVRKGIAHRYPDAEYLKYLEVMLEREKERIERERLRELEMIGSHGAQNRK